MQGGIVGCADGPGSSFLIKHYRKMVKRCSGLEGLKGVWGAGPKWREIDEVHRDRILNEACVEMTLSLEEGYEAVDADMALFENAPQKKSNAKCATSLTADPLDLLTSELLQGARRVERMDIYSSVILVCMQVHGV
jgi:hypothetical protein